MAKIKHAKGSYQHAEVKKVKRQLIKAYKITERLSYVYANIVLTGIEELDYRAILYYYKSEYENLRNRISKDIEENGEQDYMQYHLSANIAVLKLIDALHTALSLTGDYPTIPFKILDFEFKTETVDDKYNEMAYYYKNNEIVSFTKQWYAVNGDEEIWLGYLSFSKEKLKNAQKLRLKYQ